MCGERLWQEQPNITGPNYMLVTCAKGPHVAEAEPKDANRTHEGRVKLYRDNGQTVMVTVTWPR